MVDTATQLISRYGLKGLRIEDLLERTGLSKGALFHHFATKKELAFAAVQAAEVQWWARVFAPYPAVSDAWDRISLMLDRLCQVAASGLWEGGCFFLALGTEVDDQEPTLSAAVRCFFVRWQQAIEQIVREGIAEGVFISSCSPGLVAQSIISTSEGAVLLSRLGGDDRIYFDLLANLKVMLRPMLFGPDGSTPAAIQHL